jgi:hypothetical protein
VRQSHPSSPAASAHAWRVRGFERHRTTYRYSSAAGAVCTGTRCFFFPLLRRGEGTIPLAERKRVRYYQRGRSAPTAFVDGDLAVLPSGEVIRGSMARRPRRKAEGRAEAELAAEAERNAAQRMVVWSRAVR